MRASVSLSLKSLSSNEIDFFARLSVCARNGFSIATATAVGECDEPTATTHLGKLYNLSLLNLTRPGASRFVFHSLLRIFAQESAEMRGLQDRAAERHARHFIDHVRSREVTDPEVASILAEDLDDVLLAAKWLQDQKGTDYEFVIRLLPFLESRGFWREAIDLLTGFLARAEQEEEWQAAVQLRIQQAKFLSHSGATSEALSILTPIEDILGRIPLDVDRQHCESMWLNRQGALLQQIGRYDDAVNALQRSRRLLMAQGDRRGQAKSLATLGSVLQRQGHLDKAMSVLQSSYDLMGQGDKRGQAVVLNILGDVLRRKGLLDRAKAALSRSVEINEELSDWRHLAMVLRDLGNVLREQHKLSRG